MSSFPQQVGRLSCAGEESESVLIVMVGFLEYVYAAVQAQVRRFDTAVSGTDLTTTVNGLAHQHNASFLLLVAYSDRKSWYKHLCC